MCIPPILRFAALLVWIGAARVMTAQAPPAEPQMFRHTRFGFYGGTVATAHYLDLNKNNPYALSYTPLWNLPGDTLTSITGRFGASLARQNSSLDILYVPAYHRSESYSTNSNWTHRFSIHGLGDRGIYLAPRLRLELNANVAVTDFEHAILVPTDYARASTMVTSGDELADAMLHQNFTNGELASAFTGAPVLESPASLAIYGNRLLSFSGRAGLRYLYSPRLHFRFSAGGMRNQHLNSPGDVSSSYMLNSSTFVTASAEMDYSLSPRSEIGGSVVTGRSFSSLQQTFSVGAMANYRRRMGPNWFLALNGGAGQVHTLAEVAQGRTRSHALGGVMLGYSTGNHTFIGAVQRTLSEDVAVGSGTGISGRAAWTWSPGASRWVLFADYGRQGWYRDYASDLTGWRGSVGVARIILPSLSWQGGWFFAKYSGTNLGGLQNFSIGVFRMALNWTPTQFVR